MRKVEIVFDLFLSFIIVVLAPFILFLVMVACLFIEPIKWVERRLHV